MLSTKNLTCIGCPMGCELKVTLCDNKVQSITGNQCKIGITYGETECTNPTRMVTSTVAIKDGIINRVPIKTSINIPKHKVFESMELIKDIVLTAPVNIGDIIASDILGTGADFVATRTVEKIETNQNEI